MAIMDSIGRYIISTLKRNDIGYFIWESKNGIAIAIQTSDSCWTPIVFTSYQDVKMDKLFANFEELDLALIKGYKLKEKYRGKCFDCGHLFGSSYRDDHTEAKAIASFLVALTNYQPSGVLRREDYW